MLRRYPLLDLLILALMLCQEVVRLAVNQLHAHEWGPLIQYVFAEWTIPYPLHITPVSVWHTLSVVPLMTIYVGLRVKNVLKFEFLLSFTSWTSFVCGTGGKGGYDVWILFGILSISNSRRSKSKLSIHNKLQGGSYLYLSYYHLGFYR